MRHTSLLLLVALLFGVVGCHELISDKVVYPPESRVPAPSAVTDLLEGEWTIETADGIVGPVNEGEIEEDGAALEIEMDHPIAHQDEDVQPEVFTFKRNGENWEMSAESEPSRVRILPDEGGYKVIMPSIELDEEGNEVEIEQIVYLDFVLLEAAAYPDRKVPGRYLMTATTDFESSGEEETTEDEDQNAETVHARRGRNLSVSFLVEVIEITQNRIRIDSRPINIEALYTMLEDDPTLLEHEKEIEKQDSETFFPPSKTIRLTGDPEKTRKFIADHLDELFLVDDEGEEFWFEMTRVPPATSRPAE